MLTMYDSFMLYAKVATELIDAGKDITSGEVVFENMIKRSYMGNQCRAQS